MQSSNPFPTSLGASTGSLGATGDFASTNPSTDSIKSGVGTAGAALHSTVDKARSTMENLSGAAHDSIDRLASSATHTADRFADQTRRLTEAPAKAMEYSRTWVQDKPLEAVGVALALGFILGRLTAR